MTDLKVAIVGSRRRNTLKDRRIVYDLARDLNQLSPGNVVVVSGGCLKGADKFAEEAADINKMPKTIFPIAKFPEPKSKWEFTERAYARNQLIADECDIMYALVHHDRSGGTEDAARRTRALGKPVVLIDEYGEQFETLVTPGELGCEKESTDPS